MITYVIKLEELADGNVNLTVTAPACAATKAEIGYAEELKEVLKVWETTLKSRKEIMEKENEKN